MVLSQNAMYWHGFEDEPRPSINAVAAYKHEVPDFNCHSLILLPTPSSPRPLSMVVTPTIVTCRKLSD